MCSCVYGCGCGGCAHLSTCACVCVHACVVCGEHNNYYVHILFLRFHVHIFADILKHSVLTPVGDIFYAATEMAATITVRLAALAAPPPPPPPCEEAPAVTRGHSSRNGMTAHSPVALSRCSISNLFHIIQNK